MDAGKARRSFLLHFRPTGSMIAIEVSAEPSAPNRVVHEGTAADKPKLSPIANLRIDE